MNKEDFILKTNNMLKEKNIDDKLINIKEYTSKDLSKSSSEHILPKYTNFYFETLKPFEEVPGSIEQGVEEFIDCLTEEID